VRDSSADPIVLPPTGGSFRFRLDLTNLGSVSRTIDISVTLSGRETKRSIVQFSRTLAAGDSFSRSLGTYTVTGTAIVSQQVEATDSFELEKAQQ
jgi:hypothetical protein